MSTWIVVGGDGYGHCHINEEDGRKILAQMRYTDRQGKARTGAHWTPEEVEEATRDMAFPDGTTLWDKAVAFNSFYADTCKVLGEEDVLKAAFAYFFADEDAPRCKVWRYVKVMK